MRRFAAQALVAVMVLLGLALVGAEPRACAGFVSAGTAQHDEAAIAGGQPTEPEVWPPKLPFDGPVPGDLFALPTRGGDTGAGTGSSTAPTTNGAVGMIAASELPSPTLLEHLRTCRNLFALSPALTRIFEPPRGC